MRKLLVIAITFFALARIDAQIAVKGEIIWTMAGENIQNGVVLIGTNGKIEAVGPATQIKIPAGYRVLSAKVVTPGLIDAHSVIGLSGYLNQPHDQMQLDASSPIQPELRAIDAYNSEEKLVEWVRQYGVTTIHTGHAPAALVSGQTMIAKTFGRTIEEVTLVPTATIAVTLGQAGLAGQGRSPGTRAKAAAMLRSELIKAQSYKPDSSRDLKQEMWQKVLKREIPLLVTAHKAQDIMTALRIAKEFNIRVILDGASEAYLLIDEIKQAGVPVIIHPTMYRASGDAQNLSMETAAKLRAAGIQVALQSGYETYVPKTRVVLFEAAIAAANGLSQKDALATITIDAARILGIADRVGSIEVGKDGDLALFDGDPFEYTTHCIGTIINGKVASDVVR
ncbi:MAG: amidohydrolase family protein [Pyrinomonadaceae bacterium]|nr:amidohydrolase family protein [Pyrinomonadaceae bacterium]MCX7640451.1 amidohydrolase family protein [Pyrinomonadaceae bacterium]MDW8304878.1 amidohydrolase family protein [Acidobacteriota bacterium]